MTTIVLCLTALAARTQDTVYSHWPTVHQSGFDFAKRDFIYRKIGELLTRPVPSSPPKYPVSSDGKTPGWAALNDAHRHVQQRNFDAATNAAELALDEARKLGDRRLEMQTLGIIGAVSREVFLGASLKAVPYHEKALLIAQELRDSVAVITQLIALADNYGQAGRNDRMLEYLEAAVKLLNDFDQPRFRLATAIMFGCFLETQNDRPGAEKLFRSAIQIGRATRNAAIVQHLYWQLYWLYLSEGNADAADAALDSVKSTGVEVADKDWYEARYQVEKLRGNREAAYGNLEQAYRLLGEDYTRRSAEQLAGWETRLRTREKELQLEAQANLLQAQNRTRIILWWLLGLISVFLLLSIYAWYTQRQAKRSIDAQKRLIENQSEELKSLDQLKSRFFANVSHELRTPLTLIQGPINQALQSEDLPVRIRHLLEITHKNGRHLLELVNQLLELGRLDNRRPELREAPVHLTELLHLIVSSFRSSAESRDIDLRFTWQTAAGQWVSADRDKVQKILNNLLGNALKFTPAGGRVEVVASIENNRLGISVSDTGSGIHPDDLPHIFERYYQSKQRNARSEGGFGIGLAYCRELAGAMGGAIGVESKAGEGSRFWVELPLKPVNTPIQSSVPEALPPAPFVPAGRGIAAAPESPLSPRARLLMVEDHAGLQGYLGELLQNQFHLDFASDGQAAFHFLRAAETLPDLIVSDVMMPVMDGFELLEALRTDARLRDIPVIMLTARAEPRDRLRAFRLGIDDYLQKPFEVEELLVRLENALRNRASQRDWLQQNAGKDLAEPATLPADTWLAKAREYACEHLGNGQFNIDFLAGLMDMSRSTLNRRTRELTGLSANQFIQELRLQRARELLESEQGKSKSLKAVAEAVGLRSPHYLSRMYRKRFGKLPVGRTGC